MLPDERVFEWRARIARALGLDLTALDPSTLIAAGSYAFVFAWGADRIVKVSRDPHDAWCCERLRRLRASGAAIDAAPRVDSVVSITGAQVPFFVIIEERAKVLDERRYRIAELTWRFSQPGMNDERYSAWLDPERLTRELLAIDEAAGRARQASAAFPWPGPGARVNDDDDRAFLDRVVESVGSLAALGMFAGDLHDRNWGEGEGGRPVVLDLGAYAYRAPEGPPELEAAASVGEALGLDDGRFADAHAAIKAAYAERRRGFEGQELDRIVTDGAWLDIAPEVAPSVALSLAAAEVDKMHLPPTAATDVLAAQLSQRAKLTALTIIASGMPHMLELTHMNHLVARAGMHDKRAELAASLRELQASGWLARLEADGFVLPSLGAAIRDELAAAAA